ncbi:MAG: efflux RND transporter periplasmic adaptor subunit [Bacteroidota bacterium]
MKFLLKILLPILLLASCGKKEETIKPTVENISESVYASGVVKAKNQYEVFSTVSGLLQEILVKEGDVIFKGEPLLRIKNEQSRLQSQNAEIATRYNDVSANSAKLGELRENIDLARARMNNDELMLKRQRNLFAEGVGARVEVEQRELAFKNSQTAYQSANLRLKDVQKQLKFAEEQSRKQLEISRATAQDFTVKSETDGRVYRILKERGEIISPQLPVAIIGDANVFLLELQIDEYDIARVKPGQKVLVTLDSYKGDVFEAEVTKIFPIMNERSKSFTVEAEFLKAPPTLYPNLTAEANIVIQTKEKALTIPRNYLVDETYVLKENNERKKVKVGLKDYQKVEILGGLSSGEAIVKPGK